MKNYGWVVASKIDPVEVGQYLVTTARGKVMIDRWDGEFWGMCNPQNKRGAYKCHKAWTYLPIPAEVERVDE